jgi:5-oxoprolinase (ATP-hydrolysing)
MPIALVPAAPGAFSAVGLALAGESAELLEAVVAPLERIGHRALRERGRELLAAARAELAAHGRAPTRSDRGAVEVLLRHAGQGGGLWLPLTRDLAARFADLHEARFGFRADAPLEVVELRARAARPGPAAPGPSTHGRVGARAAPPRLRRVPLGGTIAVHHREELPPGARLRGPAVVEEATSVVRIPAGWVASQDGAAIGITSPDSGD